MNEGIKERDALPTSEPQQPIPISTIDRSLRCPYINMYNSLSLFCRPSRPERQLEGEDVHGDAARHHSRVLRSQVGTAEVSERLSVRA